MKEIIIKLKLDVIIALLCFFVCIIIWSYELNDMTACAIEFIIVDVLLTSDDVVITSSKVEILCSVLGSLSSSQIISPRCHGYG